MFTKNPWSPGVPNYIVIYTRVSGLALRRCIGLEKGGASKGSAAPGDDLQETLAPHCGLAIDF